MSGLRRRAARCLRTCCSAPPELQGGLAADATRRTRDHCNLPGQAAAHIAQAGQVPREELLQQDIKRNADEGDGIMQRAGDAHACDVACLASEKAHTVRCWHRCAFKFIREKRKGCPSSAVRASVRRAAGDLDFEHQPPRRRHASRRGLLRVACAASHGKHYAVFAQWCCYSCPHAPGSPLHEPLTSPREASCLIHYAPHKRPRLYSPLTGRGPQVLHIKHKRRVGGNDAARTPRAIT